MKKIMMILLLSGMASSAFAGVIANKKIICTKKGETTHTFHRPTKMDFACARRGLTNLETQFCECRLGDGWKQENITFVVPTLHPSHTGPGYKPVRHRGLGHRPTPLNQ